MTIKRATLKADMFFDELQEKFPGLTLDKIAQDLEMNPRSITNLKRGTERGDWFTQFRLAKYLSEKLGREVDVKDLFVVEGL